MFYLEVYARKKEAENKSDSKSKRALPDPSICSPQGAEGLPVAHSTEGALHVQLPSAEDLSGHADDSQLVSVCMDSRCLAESRQEYPCVCHGHYIGWPGLQPVLPGSLGLHDGSW